MLLAACAGAAPTRVCEAKVTGTEDISPEWRKSSFSGTGDCVEVRQGGETVEVRNSRDCSGEVLSFTRPEWRAFLQGARAGEFDLEA